MRPYRMRHKTGLYYQPNTHGNNLSLTGKVYCTNRNGVEEEGYTGIIISMNKDSKLLGILRDYEGKETSSGYIEYLMGVRDFEREYL